MRYTSQHFLDKTMDKKWPHIASFVFRIVQNYGHRFRRRRRLMRSVREKRRQTSEKNHGCFTATMLRRTLHWASRHSCQKYHCCAVAISILARLGSLWFFPVPYVQGSHERNRFSWRQNGRYEGAPSDPGQILPWVHAGMAEEDGEVHLISRGLLRRGHVVVYTLYLE